MNDPTLAPTVASGLFFFRLNIAIPPPTEPLLPRPGFIDDLASQYPAPRFLAGWSGGGPLTQKNGPPTL